MGIRTRIESLFRVSKDRDVTVVDVWVVSWDARYGKWCDSKERVSRAFITRKDAEDFAQLLRESQKNLCYTENINITIKKQ